MAENFKAKTLLTDAFINNIATRKYGVVNSNAFGRDCVRVCPIEL